MPRKHSTSRKRLRKPAKPDGSPLYPHNSGKWAKKIRGKLHYFGRWDDHDAALEQYESTREALESGVDPAAFDPKSFTVSDACNYFLESCEHRVKRNDLAARTFADYRATCKSLTAMLGRDATVSKLEPHRFREVSTPSLQSGMSSARPTKSPGYRRSADWFGVHTTRFGFNDSRRVESVVCD
jgi:hypothetical protein